ncbi:MAG: phage major capsid protein [Gammaproteobacteria bacterium]|nr:phage major capsid protein [Gammaproteobacteria bacterium]
MLLKRRNELNEERNRSIAQARELIERAETDGRDMTEDEQRQYDEHFSAADKARTRIEALTKQIEAERALADLEIDDDDDPERETRGTRGTQGGTGTASREYREAFSRLLTHGARALNGDQWRALEAGTGSEGGFLIAPMQVMDALIKAKDNLTFMRRLGTVETVSNGTELGAPSLDADPDDADWTSELGTGSEDSTMRFGRREWHPHPLAKRIKVSRKLLRASTRAEAIVLQRLAYKFAVTEENSFMNGDGAGKPLGVFVANSSGISTSRDISTGNTSSALTMNGLLNAKYACKSGYHTGASWIFHRDAVNKIAQLRSDSGAGAGTGDYLWQPSKVVGEPDTLMGHPVYMSEYAPSTFTTGLYVGIFGDFSHYWIADAMNVEIQRLEELYAETNQIGFIAREETDGMPVLEEAFARVTLA